MRASDQHLTREEAVALSDEYRRAADDWLGKYLTSVLAGHGAGLVALAAYLASRSVAVTPYFLLVASAVFFLLGTGLTAGTIIKFQWAAQSQGEAYQKIVDERNFDTLTTRISREERDELINFKNLMSENTDSAFNYATRVDKDRLRQLQISVVMLMIGLLLAITAIAVGSYPKQEKALGTPTSSVKPRLELQKPAATCSVRAAKERATCPA